jgi:hypothetical protein
MRILSAMRNQIAVFFSALVMSLSMAEGRVFDFKSESFALYVGGSFGSVNAGDGAYALASGHGTQFDKKVQSATSAEFGILFSTTRFVLKFGGEYLMPREQTGITGTSVAGTELFTLNSTIAAFIPMGNLEFLFWKGATSRGYFGGGYGQAFVTLSNEYLFTSAGTTAFGIGNYKEIAAGTAPFYQSYMGWEFLFTDTATLAFQVGYRSIKVEGLSATQAVSAITGPESTNSPIFNMDGGQRSLDLGGGFANINFRFYL